VIIASSASWYVSHESFYLTSPSGEIGRTPKDKAQLWSQGVGSVVQELSRAGVPSVVIHSVPHFDRFDLRSCPNVLLHRPDACGVSLSRSGVEAQQRLARTAEDTAVDGVPLASAVDFTDDLCRADACRSFRGAQMLYRDGRHLSVTGALTLTDRFGDVIRGAVRAVERPVDLPRTGAALSGAP
jgi:hypothetical protein